MVPTSCVTHLLSVPDIDLDDIDETVSYRICSEGENITSTDTDLYLSSGRKLSELEAVRNSRGEEIRVGRYVRFPHDSYGRVLGFDDTIWVIDYDTRVHTAKLYINAEILKTEGNVRVQRNIDRMEDAFSYLARSFAYFLHSYKN